MVNADHDIQKALLAALPADLAVASINQIEQRLTAQGVTVSRRTLQRHLGLLEASGHIIKQGRSVAVTYRLVEPRMSVETAGIALSPAGREVLNLVTQPVIAKRPVTYNQAFLDRYIPNTTFYLPESLRSQLHDMGRTGAANRPAGTHLRDVIGRTISAILVVVVAPSSRIVTWPTAISIDPKGSASGLPG